MPRSQDRGRAGERTAEAHLVRSGWRVLDRNWRFHHKEIDLVVERAGTVAFVEVKTRFEGSLGHPLEAIGPRKRRDLRLAAQGWIARHGAPYHTFRFDAVTVQVGNKGRAVDHVEDAWRL